MDWRLILVLVRIKDKLKWEKNPAWLCLNKIEVYFWLLSKLKGRFFRISIGLQLPCPFYLVALLTVSFVLNIAS